MTDLIPLYKMCDYAGRTYDPHYGYVHAECDEGTLYDQWGSRLEDLYGTPIDCPECNGTGYEPVGILVNAELVKRSNDA